MGIELNEIIPLGRSFPEYVSMFELSKSDLDKKILDCGGGPSSFNYEMKTRNKRVTTIDPIYEFSREDINNRINETFPNIIEQTRANQAKFVWKNIKSVDELSAIRMSAMKLFLNDFEPGKEEGRYQKAELPNLDFSNSQFDLALSSHFLFLYTGILSLDFHLKSIAEMLRVASDVRIFPLLDLNANPSPYVEQIKKFLETRGLHVTIKTVNYEFQKGGNQLMKISRLGYIS